MLSKELEFTLNNAFKEARTRRFEFMTVEHLLLALIDNPTAAQVLRACGGDLETLRDELDGFVEERTRRCWTRTTRARRSPRSVSSACCSGPCSTCRARARRRSPGANVLVAIFGEQDSQTVYLLNKQNTSRGLDVVNYISHGIAKNSQEESEESEEGAAEYGQEEGEGDSKPLDKFATNLNQRAQDGKIDPLIGRDHEVERASQVLCRRRKNNPLLVGEAGVGKTAIAEGLAKKIVDGQVPDVLAEATIYSLDLGALVAGYQVPRRFREAPQEHPQPAQEGGGRDPLHRRDPHHHRCRRRLRRRHGCLQPDQAHARLRRAQVHRLDHLSGIPWHL